MSGLPGRVPSANLGHQLTEGMKMKMKICSFPDCGRKHKGRGYCESHLRHLREGKPLRVISTLGHWHPHAPVAERLERLSQRDGDCLIWVGRIDRGGYGALKINGKYMKAHRASYVLAHGMIPEGLVIDHLCRVRACINPDHLEAVTGLENTRRGIRSNVRRTTCNRGHDLTDPSNLILTKKDVPGKYSCRACRREWSAEYEAKRTPRVRQKRVRAIIPHF